MTRPAAGRKTILVDRLRTAELIGAKPRTVVTAGENRSLAGRSLTVTSMGAPPGPRISLPSDRCRWWCAERRGMPRRALVASTSRPACGTISNICAVKCDGETASTVFRAASARWRSRSGRPWGRAGRRGCRGDRSKTRTGAAAENTVDQSRTRVNRLVEEFRALNLIAADHADRPGEPAGQFGADPRRENQAGRLLLVVGQRGVGRVPALSTRLEWDTMSEIVADRKWNWLRRLTRVKRLIERFLPNRLRRPISKNARHKLDSLSGISVTASVEGTVPLRTRRRIRPSDRRFSTVTRMPASTRRRASSVIRRPKQPSAASRR